MLQTALLYCRAAVYDVSYPSLPQSETALGSETIIVIARLSDVHMSPSNLQTAEVLLEVKL